MNFDGIKKKVKSNPRIECLYMCLKGLKDNDLAKQIVGIKRNPYNIVISRYGSLNPDKMIYYILFDKEARFNGFCSLYRIMLMHLAYAEDLNFIPVICFGDSTLYYDPTVKETNNAFDYYFEPVSEIGYQEVMKSKNVIISKGADAGAFGTTGAYSVPDSEIDFLAIYQKKYIRLKSSVEECFWGELKNIVSGGKTLGVHVRATDFNKGYNRHPVAVTPEEYLQKTKRVFAENEYEKVFLATDDENIIRLYYDVFADNLFYYKDTYRSKNGEAIHYGKQDVQRTHHKYYLGLEIIKDFYTLGYCEGLIAGNSNVSMCARIIKSSIGERYTTLDILDKGINHNLHETRSKFGSMLKSNK